MLFRFRAKFAGGDAHISIFAGPDSDHLGKAGDICLRETELSALKLILQHGGHCSLVRDGDDVIIDALSPPTMLDFYGVPKDEQVV